VKKGKDMRRMLVFGLIPAALCANSCPSASRGVPFGTAFDTVRTANAGYLSGTKRYVVGGAFELRFPFAWEWSWTPCTNGLNYDSFQIAAPDASLAVSTVANSWEFPLLFKLRAPSPVLRPYLTAGPSFRHLSGLRQFVAARIGVLPAPQEVSRPTEPQQPLHQRFHYWRRLELGRRFRLAPEVRYTTLGLGKLQLSFAARISQQFESTGLPPGGPFLTTHSSTRAQAEKCAARQINLRR